MVKRVLQEMFYGVGKKTIWLLFFFCVAGFILYGVDNNIEKASYFSLANAGVFWLFMSLVLNESVNFLAIPKVFFYVPLNGKSMKRYMLLRIFAEVILFLFFTIFIFTVCIVIRLLAGTPFYIGNPAAQGINLYIFLITLFVWRAGILKRQFKVFDIQTRISGRLINLMFIIYEVAFSFYINEFTVRSILDGKLKMPTDVQWILIGIGLVISAIHAVIYGRYCLNSIVGKE